MYCFMRVEHLEASYQTEVDKLDVDMIYNYDRKQRRPFFTITRLRLTSYRNI